MRFICASVSFISACFFLTAPLAAQHSYTPGDVRDGERLYLSNCSVCHGPDGNMVPGTDLAHGSFRRTNSDEGLQQIILKGIAGTAMPPHNFSEFQAMTIVAFLRSLASSAQSSSAAGNAAHGKAIFEGAGNCLSCHRVQGVGSRLGPDLTDIGLNRRAPELERSLLDPDAEILPQNRFVKVTTKEGRTVTGRLLNQDAFTLQMLDSQERLVSYRRADLKDLTFPDKSPMPSYRGKLAPAEVADVVSYLVSLKGIEKQ
jgi:putative heme-binding domain-containing protein